MDLEKYFLQFRKGIVGVDHNYETPYGWKKLVYADWVASGRIYKPIEEKLMSDIYPFVGNTHSESSHTGYMMTNAYNEAKQVIRKHVNAAENDIVIFSGFGMTSVINKLQRILGLRYPGQFKEYNTLSAKERPIVFITHMEHNSNYISWLETICDVSIIGVDDNGLVDLNSLETLLKSNLERKYKIGSFTSASNVTGIITPYYEMAEIMHKYGGICLVDFSTAAPYLEINMHPKNSNARLDGIFFSPHKFLGGPGSSGVMIFDSALYNRKAPDNPGGGTVDWTNPWGGYKYIDDIELREDGGTPGFIQAVRIALAIKLKEEMGIKNIRDRDRQLIELSSAKLKSISSLHILDEKHEKGVGIFSFYADNIHYNLIVKLLNDRYGIQVRGGCSCAGTYGHFLYNIDPFRSKRIMKKIEMGDLSEKPGWVRLSLHPTMPNNEIYYIINSIDEIISNYKDWTDEYSYSPGTNEFSHRSQLKAEYSVMI